MEHFESVADVNEWDEASKKKWLRVRLTGRAATAYKRLTAEVKGDYDATIKALTDRFEPESRKELFLAEFQCRRKKKTEDWATFADNLLILAEKVYPSLQPEAQATGPESLFGPPGQPPCRVRGTTEAHSEHGRRRGGDVRARILPSGKQRASAADWSECGSAGA